MKMAAQNGPSTFEFVENKGQWDSRIQFKGELPAGNFFLQKNGFTVVQHNTDDLIRFYENQHGHRISKAPGQHTGHEATAKSLLNKTPDAATSQPETYILHSHTYQVQFAGGAANPEIVADKA